MNDETLDEMCDRLLEDWLEKLSKLRGGTKYALYVLSFLPHNPYYPAIRGFRWLVSPGKWEEVYSDTPRKLPQAFAFADNPDDLMPDNTAVLWNYPAVVCKAKTPFKYVPASCYRDVAYRGKRIPVSAKTVKIACEKLGVDTLVTTEHVASNADDSIVSCVRDCECALLYDNEQRAMCEVVVKAFKQQPFKE